MARLLFPSTSKSKICPLYSSPRFTCPNQRSLLHLNTESRLFSFNRLRGEFVLTRCSSWCCSTITALLFHYAPNVSYLLVWGPNILMNKPSSLWYSWYIWPRVFNEIALQVSTGKSSLNFPHAERNLLIVASSQPPPGQIVIKIGNCQVHQVFHDQVGDQQKIFHQLPVHYKTPSRPEIRIFN